MFLSRKGREEAKLPALGQKASGLRRLLPPLVVGQEGAFAVAVGARDARARLQRALVRARLLASPGMLGCQVFLFRGLALLLVLLMRRFWKSALRSASVAAPVAGSPPGFAAGRRVFRPGRCWPVRPCRALQDAVRRYRGRRRAVRVLPHAVISRPHILGEGGAGQGGRGQRGAAIVARFHLLDVIAFLNRLHQEDFAMLCPACQSECGQNTSSAATTATDFCIIRFCAYRKLLCVYSKKHSRSMTCCSSRPIPTSFPKTLPSRPG